MRVHASLLLPSTRRAGAAPGRAPPPPQQQGPPQQAQPDAEPEAAAPEGPAAAAGPPAWLIQDKVDVRVQMERLGMPPVDADVELLIDNFCLQVTCRCGSARARRAAPRARQSRDLVRPAFAPLCAGAVWRGAEPGDLQGHLETHELLIHPSGAEQLPRAHRAVLLGAARRGGLTVPAVHTHDDSQATPLVMDVWDFEQLLYAAALNRLDAPTADGPFLQALPHQLAKRAPPPPPEPKRKVLPFGRRPPPEPAPEEPQPQPPAAEDGEAGVPDGVPAAAATAAAPHHGSADEGAALAPGGGAGAGAAAAARAARHARGAEEEKEDREEEAALEALLQGLPEAERAEPPAAAVEGGAAGAAAGAAAADAAAAAAATAHAELDEMLQRAMTLPASPHHVAAGLGLDDLELADDEQHAREQPPRPAAAGAPAHADGEGTAAGAASGGAASGGALAPAEPHPPRAAEAPEAAGAGAAAASGRARTQADGGGGGGGAAAARPSGAALHTERWLVAGVQAFSDQLQDFVGELMRLELRTALHQVGLPVADAARAAPAPPAPPPAPLAGLLERAAGGGGAAGPAEPAAAAARHPVAASLGLSDAQWHDALCELAPSVACLYFLWCVRRTAPPGRRPARVYLPLELLARLRALLRTFVAMRLMTPVRILQVRRGRQLPPRGVFFVARRRDARGHGGRSRQQRHGMGGGRCRGRAVLALFTRLPTAGSGLHC